MGEPISNPGKPHMRRAPLQHHGAQPQPWLEETTTVRVRFNEVDAIRVVWHGHYAAYFEDARRAFGRKYGIDYSDLLEHKVAVPVVHLHVDFFAPARFSDLLEIKARLFKSEAARLHFDYEVRRAGETKLLASGSTVQVFTSLEGELLLTWPSFMQQLLKKWEPLWQMAG